MAQNSREKSRRSIERRMGENRKMRHVFGSPKWIEEIKKHYAMWPKEDRRSEDRRGIERRNLDRRDVIRVGNTSARALAKKGVGLLSDEEKQMLKELNLD